MASGNLRLAFYSDLETESNSLVDERVLEWLPASGTVGYIPSSPDRARVWFQTCADHYERYGISLKYFGLEDEYDPAKRDELLACDAIHLSGGNTYRFLYWLHTRDLFHALRKYVHEGGVLIGVSAGAILMTPDIRTSSICGDTLYPGLNDFAGLSLVDFAVVPHYDGSESMESAMAEFSRGFPGHVYPLPDGAGIIVDVNSRDFIAKFEFAPG